MARVEPQKDHIEKLEKEISKLKKKVKKRGKEKKLSCLGLIGIAVLVVLTGITYFLAKTGIATIPLVTPLVYDEPKPTYWIDPFSIPDTDFDTLVQKQLGISALDLLRGRNKTLSLRFTEAELTGALIQERKKDQETNITYSQVALFDEQMELFLRVEKKNKEEIGILLSVQPQLRDGEVDIQVLSFKLGAAAIPKGIGQLIINSSVEPVLDTSIAFVKNIGRISGITINDGTLIIDVTLEKP